jgi:hypothetical protein
MCEKGESVLKWGSEEGEVYERMWKRYVRQGMGARDKRKKCEW